MYQLDKQKILTHTINLSSLKKMKNCLHIGLCLGMEIERTERRKKVKSREIFHTIYANILACNMSFQQSCIILKETKLFMWRLSKFDDLLFFFFKPALYFIPMKDSNYLLNAESWLRALCILHPALSIILRQLWKIIIYSC